MKDKRVVLGVSGGIAAYKAVEVLRGLTQRGADVRVVMTTHATQFVTPLTFHTLSGHPVITDLFPPNPADPLEHIHVVQGEGEKDAADLVVVAPATANLIGKYARGIADDFLTTCLLAAPCPVLLAPAMNQWMLRHPAVQENLARLRQRGVHILDPETGELACLDEGEGRLVEPSIILSAAASILERSGDLRGRRILVTAGPTREPWDAVRVLTNRSSGKMGYALAACAQRRGAEVILVSGPASLPDPPGVEVVRVETAEEMRQAVWRALDNCQAVIKAAAVSDYRPRDPIRQKSQKGPPETTLVLERTADILAELGQRKGNRVLVGFAAETSNSAENAAAKLKAKNLDLVVANSVGGEEETMGADVTRALLLDASGRRTETPALTKTALADIVLDRVREIFEARSSKVFGRTRPRAAG